MDSSQYLTDGVKIADTTTMKPIVVMLLPFVFFFSIPVFSTQKIQDRPQIPIKNATDAVSQTQQLESIQLIVESFIRSSQANKRNVSVTIKALDKRLRLANCLVPLEPTWANGSQKLGRVTVRVACSSPKPWRVHIQARVTIEGMVWTLARGVRRGELVSRELLVRQEVTLGGNNGAYSTLNNPIIDIKPWLGFEFTQRVSAGKVLNDRMLKPAKVIKKGDVVVIRHKSKGLELQTRGVALSDAGSQQQTKVRNSSSGKIIDVVVVSPGLVQILQ